MTLQVDIKYLNLISGKLRNFKKKDDRLWNCSCPLCGDSKKDKRKARGFFYIYKAELWFKCHNCDLARPFSIFIREVDTNLSKEYNLEKFKKTRNLPKKKEKDIMLTIGQVPKFENINILGKLTPIESLLIGHPAKQYVLRRKIPKKFFLKLFYVSKFMKWTNTLLPNKFEKDILKYDSPRLVIPYFDKNGKIFAYSGRSFDQNDKSKYILIKLDENMPRIYGLDRVDYSKCVYEVEGAIDSLFLDNAVAISGIGGGENLFNDYVIILDNDKRNKHICRRLKKLIEDGEKVCIWNNDVNSGKDINDLILDGWSPNKIKNLIDRCTYRGLEAMLEFNNWRRY